MLQVYVRNGDSIERALKESIHDLSKIVWIDIYEPTRDEEVFLESLLKIDIPTRDEMHEIEFTSRLYHRQETLYATTIFITKAETDTPESHAFTFILKKNFMVSVRYVDIAPFNNFAQWQSTLLPHKMQGNMILVRILEILIDQMADMLENAGRKIDGITAQVFHSHKVPKESSVNSSLKFQEILSTIGLIGDLLSKSRESLLTITRMLGYLMNSIYFNKIQDDQKSIEMMVRDISSLSDHASFLSNKVNFLLDATLGMINIEQNRIIKLFSVAAVVFLPPTLVASIYGMNFKIMPELEWVFGYPSAILLMLLSAWLPYRFFKKKGWL